MKFSKYLFFVIFVFLPSALFSQILVSGDIDILINGSSIIGKTVDELTARNNETMKDFQNKIDAFTLDMVHIIETAVEEERIISDDEFNILKMEYQKLLQINIPIELNDTFKKIGWNNNGYEKFMTIGFGMVVLLIQEVEEYELTGVNILFNLLDKNDIEIIKNRMLEIEEVM